MTTQEAHEEKKLVLEYAKLAFRQKQTELTPEGALRMKTLEDILNLPASAILDKAQEFTLQS